MAENKPQFSFWRVVSKSKLLSALAIGVFVTASLAVAENASNIRASQSAGGHIVDTTITSAPPLPTGCLWLWPSRAKVGNSFDGMKWRDAHSEKKVPVFVLNPEPLRLRTQS